MEADVLKPLPISGHFDSIGLNLVLHCLPRRGDGKQRAIVNLARVLADDGVLFGATILGDRAHHTFWSRPPLAATNRRGVFDNLDDDEIWLRAALENSFTRVTIDVVGSMALSSACGHRQGDTLPGKGSVVLQSIERR